MIPVRRGTARRLGLDLPADEVPVDIGPSMRALIHAAEGSMAEIGTVFRTFFASLSDRSGDRDR